MSEARDEREATRQPQLELEHPSLGEARAVPVPPGYRIRAFRPGDESDWCRLVNAALSAHYTEGDVLRAVFDPAGFDPESLLFAETDREVVGTACAVWRPGYPQDTGYVHMVAVDSAHRGKGIGRALVLAVIHRMRERGFRKAVLQTDDFRLPAIRLYLGLGFRPRFSHGSHEARWRSVYQRLGVSEEAS